MKVVLRVRKNLRPLYEGKFDIGDAESFGKACAEIWTKLHEQGVKSATSIGALMEINSQDVVEQLNGAEITVTKL
jgi:hypothetical protein